MSKSSFLLSPIVRESLRVHKPQSGFHQVYISNLSDVLSNLVILDRALRDLSASRQISIETESTSHMWNHTRPPVNSRSEPHGPVSDVGMSAVHHVSAGQDGGCGWVPGGYQVGTDGYQWVYMGTNGCTPVYIG